MVTAILSSPNKRQKVTTSVLPRSFRRDGRTIFCISSNLKLERGSPKSRRVSVSLMVFSTNFRLRWQHGTRSCSPGGEALKYFLLWRVERQGPHMTLNLICNGSKLEGVPFGSIWMFNVQQSLICFDDLFVETCCCRFFVSSHNSLR